MLQPCLDTTPSNDNWRPVAYVTLQDAALRARIAATLERTGFAVVLPPTGVHLVQSIADLIDGRRPWLRPALLVVDAHAPGCSGLTLADGLRDLGITIPLALVTREGEPPQPAAAAPSLRVVSPEAAEAAVCELAASVTGRPRHRAAEPPAYRAG